MKQILLYLLSAAAVGLTVASCGGSKKSEEVPQEVAETISTHDSALSSAISSGDIGQASRVADSLALMVDDLTPAQSVNVLATFVGVVEGEVSGHHSRKALETMRKYVDVYDIALGINPKDMRKAIESDTRYNYDSLATAYRNRLNDYAYAPAGDSQEPAPGDTLKNIQNVPDDESSLPVNIRPAR